MEAPLSFDTYQSRATRTAIYPGRGELLGLLYTALGLAGEAGEVANKCKKCLRDDGQILTPERRKMIQKELAGTLWYCAAMATELGVSLGDVASGNLDELADRKDRGTLRGDGDNR